MAGVVQVSAFCIIANVSLDGLLSLGFGRPQISSPVTANEMAFVHILAMDERRSEAELQNARLIASLVQLSLVGRKPSVLTSDRASASCNPTCPEQCACQLCCCKSTVRAQSRAHGVVRGVASKQ